MKTFPETNACLVPLPRTRREMVEEVSERYEHRPRRKGEASESRRIEEGFAMLNGEGVYDD